MVKSIKLQIMEKLLALMQPLKVDQTFRVIERGFDLSVNSAIRPSLQIYDGPERFKAKDTRGRTYDFDVGFKILLESTDLASAKDLIVPKIQAIIEGNLQLEHLATIIDGGDEVPILAETSKPLGGSLITWTIQYRRLLGDPYTTY